MRLRRSVVFTVVSAFVGLSISHGNAVAASAGPIKLDRDPTAAEWEAGVVACQIQIIGQRRSGEFETSPVQCWIVAKDQRSAPGDPASGSVAMSYFGNVGYHYDGYNYTGSYITVAGTVCNGGWLNLSWDWINRISSTWSPCWVGHYDGYNLTGTSDWVSVGNLGWVNNAANSLQYW